MVGKIQTGFTAPVPTRMQIWAPWWKVDLKQKYKVNVVVVTGRSDGSMERMMGAEVRIGNSPDNNNPV
ncbi:unnamed protein product [Staurois parvus]|uniref:Uncharacterized protein n=1 Tax=Staurois parvus TaxID=386267 RepID=A0ABN9GDH9_9NEOB|nr:unnamed protein product [Staurois parvus]